jgi:hypothetical protein
MSDDTVDLATLAPGRPLPSPVREEAGGRNLYNHFLAE